MKVGMRMKFAPSSNKIGATSSFSRPHLLAYYCLRYCLRGFRFRHYHRNQSQTTADFSAAHASFDTS